MIRSGVLVYIGDIATLRVINLWIGNAERGKTRAIGACLMLDRGSALSCLRGSVSDYWAERERES